jgi:hypothetical protein
VKVRKREKYRAGEADKWRKVEFEKGILERRRKGENGDLAYGRKRRKGERTNG